MIALAAVGLALVVVGDAPPLELADLAAYHRALEPAGADPAVPVDFAALWKTPGAWTGHRVEVAGRVARVFRQPAVGEFPPLVEAWLTTPAGDPLCVVFPDRAPDPAPAIGSTVRFRGTFLRQLRYAGGDGDRLAPWVVGPDPPVRNEMEATRPAGSSGRSAGPDLAVGLAVGLVVVLVLVRRHLARPVRRPRRDDADPPPRFEDGGEAGFDLGPLRFEDGGRADS